MGTTTPIHDALAEALRVLQQDFDLTWEIPIARPDEDPAAAVDGATEEAPDDGLADEAPDEAPDAAVHDVPEDADEDTVDEDTVDEDTGDEGTGDEGSAHEAPETAAGEDTADEAPDAAAVVAEEVTVVAEPPGDPRGAPDDGGPADDPVDPAGHTTGDPVDADPADLVTTEPAAPIAPTVAPDAEQVVALAWQEADERGHGCFGTGHLLLGLVRAEGTEAGLLAAAGITTLTAGAAMALVASSSVSEPVVPAGDHAPVADASVAEVLEAAAAGGQVTAAALLTALLARRWGQAAEMLAALGVESGELATVATEIAARPSVAPRPMPRDPSGLLSSAWRRHAVGA